MSGKFLHYRNFTIDKSQCIGQGAFGAVVKAKCDQLPCAAKIIHQEIINPTDSEAEETIRRFQNEMMILEHIRHPNIVQYFGMVTDPDTSLPVLLMELLDESLTNLLERSQQPLAYSIQVDICHDIALAVAYLHSNQIIHRNLSSNNVLMIAGRRAKLSGFGKSRLIRTYTGDMMTAFMHPAEAYMPPEVWKGKYSTKIDCFSEGVIIIQVCTRLLPVPGPRTRLVQDSRSFSIETVETLDSVPEIERRKNHIDLVSPTHPLLPIALDCLRDSEFERPFSEEVCERLAYLKETREYRESMEQADKQQSEICTWSLHGVEVCAEIAVVVYSSHDQQITWSGYGLRLHILEGSLPAGMEQCTINIKVSLAGQYEFPENSHLISAIFWLHCETVFKFTRPITVEIQHCAGVISRNLEFVRAVCSQKQLPYTFKLLTGQGNFTSHSSYGAIELNSFSGVGVVENGEDSHNYLARVLYKELSHQRTRYIMEIYIVVTWNLDAHCTVMSTHNHFKDAQLVTDQPIRFESDRVKFAISNTPNEWRIRSLNSPEILKKDVDAFTPGKTSWIPYSMFKAKFSADVSLICDLECDVDIEGAMQPHNKFTIDISPQDIPQHAASPDPVNQHFPLTQGTRLTEHHLATLLSQLSIHAAKWREIGTYLGFKQGELDNIQSNVLPASTDFTTKCLNDMLTKWLQWAPGDSRGSASFATLEALKSALRQVGLGVTAHELKLQTEDNIVQPDQRSSDHSSSSCRIV